MADRSEIRAGLLVIAALTILGAATLWIVGFSPFRGRTIEYEILVKSSSGVRQGDRVRVSGIRVGRVKEMELRAGEEWPVVFTVGLDEDVRLTKGSTARITSDGLLGAPYLQIEAGPQDAPLLAAGSRIMGDTRGTLTDALAGLGDATDRLPGLLDTTAELVGKINSEIDPLLAGLQGVLSEENVDSLSGTLAALRPMLEEIRPKLSHLLGRLDSVTGEIEGAVAGVPDLTAELTGLVEDLKSAVGEDGSRLASLLESAESTLGSADGAFSTVGGNSAELDAMIRDLRTAAANLRSVSQTLKEHPALLLRFPRPPERTTGGRDE